MLLKAVAFVLVLSCGVYADPKGRTDFRMTMGLCLRPEADRCSGFDASGKPSDILFQRLGKTTYGLGSYNYKRLSHDCTNNGAFNGFRWVNSTEDERSHLSHAVLTDKQGTVAGMQFFMPYSEIDQTAEQTYRFDQPSIQNITFKGVKYLQITVYFINPSIICTIGRDPNQLESEGTVRELYLQIGSSPDFFRQFSLRSPPKTAEETRLLMGWNQNNCYRSKGVHRYFHVDKWDEENCESFLPFFLVYDNEENGGDLTGFGFVVPGRTSSPALQLPPLHLMRWMTGSDNSTESTPKCITKLFDTLGITSLHVFFNEEPYKFTCANARRQSQLSEGHQFSAEGSPWSQSVGSGFSFSKFFSMFMHGFYTGLQSMSPAEKQKIRQRSRKLQNTRGHSSQPILVHGKADFDTRLQRAESKLVVVNFFAEWCDPCKYISTTVDKLSGEYTDVVFLKVDVDENKDIATEYGVRSAPTFVLLKNSVKVAEVVGPTPQKLRQLIEANI